MGRLRRTCCGPVASNVRWQAVFIFRALVLLALLAWSSVAIVATGAWAVGFVRAVFNHPTPTAVAFLVASMVPVYAWLSFVGLSVGWVIQRRFRKGWVLAGTAAGLVSIAFITAKVPQAFLYAFPSMLFAAWVCWFHVERPENAA